MKSPIKVLAILAVLFFSGTTYAIQLLNSSAATIVKQPIKTEISVEDLPDIVREGFDLSDYSALAINKIYKVVDQNGITTYEFVLGDNNDVVIFSEAGKAIE